MRMLWNVVVKSCHRNLTKPDIEQPPNVDQPGVITGLSSLVRRQVRTEIVGIFPRTGQSPDRPPANATLPVAVIRTMTGQ